MVLLLWHWKKQPVKSLSPISADTNGASPVAARSRQSVNSLSQPFTTFSTASTNMVIAASQDKGEQIKEGLADLNDVPIEFYGKLEDQFGSPVATAQIAASIRIYNGVQSTVERLTAISDANGFFQVKGGKGESLGLWPSKEGYTLATKDTEFKYSYMYADHYVVDSKNPTVIKMWKLQRGEPLVYINQHYKFYYTNAPVNFDLIAGKIVPSNGDLKITMNRPDGIISQQNPQNWSIQIDVVEGGCIATSFQLSQTTFFAPESGYNSTAVFSSNNGPDLVDQMLFIRSRNGNIYSKLHLLFGINNTSDGFVDVVFRGVANTNSSRNWEAAPPQ